VTDLVTLKEWVRSRQWLLRAESHSKTFPVYVFLIESHIAKGPGCRTDFRYRSNDVLFMVFFRAAVSPAEIRVEHEER
jgi:hypothetical protein